MKKRNRFTQINYCPLKKSFWGWCETHIWGYITKEKRKCFKCGAEEILFGTFTESGTEDWRTKYI
jgi:hypothetical protein